MWTALYHFLGNSLGSIFSFLKPESVNWQAVVKTQNEVITSMQSRQNEIIDSMQGRIDVMDKEFKQAMERRDTELHRAFERIEMLERDEAKCQRLLTKARESIGTMRGQIKNVQQRLIEAEKVKVVREQPVYQEKTLKQTEILIEEHEKETKVEKLPPLE